jgi:ABC-type bacteriocin/lantibiotic exporter with double-glycine peptidase domain
VNQIYTWDCGLACVVMVLKTIGVNNFDIEALAELCCTNRSFPSIKALISSLLCYMASFKSLGDIHMTMSNTSMKEV